METAINWFYQLTKEEQLAIREEFCDENFGLYEEFLQRKFSQSTND